MITREQVTRRLADFAAECRDKHIKATHQRMEILRELASTGEHPDAETIFKRVRRRIPAVSSTRSTARCGCSKTRGSFRASLPCRIARASKPTSAATIILFAGNVAGSRISTARRWTSLLRRPPWPRWAGWKPSMSNCGDSAALARGNRSDEPPGSFFAIIIVIITNQ